MSNDITKLMQDLGLSRQPRFVDRAPPRVPDLEQIRALHVGTLSPEMADEVEDLITLFREWHDAERQVLIESATTFQERASEGKLATHSSEATEFGGITHEHSGRERRTRSWLMAAVAVAATILIVVATSVWFLRQNKHRTELAYLDDPFGRLFVKTDGSISGLAAFPGQYHKTIEDMLRGRELALPENVRSHLRVLRSAESTSMFVRPVGTAVRSEQPLFQWKARDQAQGYKILIYALNGAPSDAPVFESDLLTALSWRTPQQLSRGEAYEWDVIVIIGGSTHRSQETRPQFRVLSSNEIRQLEDMERECSESYLARAAAYVQIGLLDEARQELGHLVEDNPNSEIAKKLLESIPRNR